MKFFLGEELNLPSQEIPLEDRIIGREYHSKNIVEDTTKLHEQARLVMADLEDIMYSAVVRAISDCFGEK